MISPTPLADAIDRTDAGADGRDHGRRHDARGDRGGEQHHGGAFGHARRAVLPSGRSSGHGAVCARECCGCSGQRHGAGSECGSSGVRSAAGDPSSAACRTGLHACRGGPCGASACGGAGAGAGGSDDWRQDMRALAAAPGSHMAATDA